MSSRSFNSSVQKEVSAKDKDVFLWLENTLGNINQGWTSMRIVSQMNPERLASIKDCFTQMSSDIQIKILISFIHFSKSKIEEYKELMIEIIEIGRSLDVNPDVNLISEMIKTFPHTNGHLTLDAVKLGTLEHSTKITNQLIEEVQSYKPNEQHRDVLPIEFMYLNPQALSEELPVKEVIVFNQSSNSKGRANSLLPLKHFSVKPHKKSLDLRDDLLKRSKISSDSLSKFSLFPVRQRQLPRKVDSNKRTAGIQSTTTTATKKEAIVTENDENFSNVFSPSRAFSGKKSFGSIMLDISEQPQVTPTKRAKKEKVAGVLKTKIKKEQTEKILEPSHGILD